MEPVHYVKAFRRRWWVVVVATIVGASAAWVMTATAAPVIVGGSGPPVYTATTVMWNTGAPTIGQGSPITSMDALASIVNLPAVAAIAAKDLDQKGGILALAAEVQGSVDQASGFLDLTATSSDPKHAVAVSLAFSKALVLYLQRLNVTRVDQQQANVTEQIRTLQKQGVDPTVIESLRSELAQLAVLRTAPVPIAVIQKPVAERELPAASSSSSSGTISVPKSRTVRVILGAVIGLLAGLALVLVLERFDTRIRTARAAEEAFGLPVLAEVPAIKRRRRNKVVTATEPYSRAADAFRLVGVAATRWPSNGNGKATANGNGGGNGGGNGKHRAEIILVTSPEVKDGKTTVAANLAAAIAQSGKRVVVISCDLRRPTLHRSLGVSDHPGVTDALRQMNGEDDPKGFDASPYLEPCSIVRVGVVPSGGVTQQPGELLGSPKMETFLDRVRKLTDVVILDCAPLVVASDVAPLIPQVDGVIMVARAGKTRREVANNAATIIERMGTHTAGVVLNEAREFSIPLAKRGMYKPSRGAAKATVSEPIAPIEDAPETIDIPETDEATSEHG